MRSFPVGLPARRISYLRPLVLPSVLGSMTGLCLFGSFILSHPTDLGADLPEV